MVAMGRPDRALAVLVDHDTVGPDEPVGVVKGKRPARVAPWLIAEPTGPALDEPKVAAIREARSG